MGKKTNPLEQACRHVAERLVNDGKIAPQYAGVDVRQCAVQAGAVEQAVGRGVCRQSGTDPERLAECLYTEHKDVVAALLSPPFGDSFAAASRGGCVVGVPQDKIRLANAYWHFLRERDAASWQTLKTAAHGAVNQKATTMALSYVVHAVRYQAISAAAGVDVLLAAPYFQTSGAGTNSYPRYLLKNLLPRAGTGAAIRTWCREHPDRAAAVRSAVQATAAETTDAAIRREADLACAP